MNFLSGKTLVLVPKSARHGTDDVGHMASTIYVAESGSGVEHGYILDGESGSFPYQRACRQTRPCDRLGGTVSEDNRARPKKLPRCDADSFEAQQGLPRELVMIVVVFVDGS